MPRGNTQDTRHQSPLDLAATVRDADVLNMVDRALSAGEVLMAYQPVMQAQAPGRVAFYEGLVRVLDATGRVIPAVQFMGEAEHSELGRKLDCQSLRLGLKALRAHPQLRLSVNMSARSIGYKPWRQVLSRFLKQDPTLGERLILEISEKSAMTVPEIVSGFMDEHQRDGISFAMDEFGSGMAAIKYLKDFCFDAVKIDGQLTTGISANADHQVIMSALMSVARHFDMFTVATRVEQTVDADYLMAIGVDCVQGYLYGVPAVRPPWLGKPDNRLFG